MGQALWLKILDDRFSTFYPIQASIIHIISLLGSLRIHIAGHQLFEVHNHIQNKNLDHLRVNLKDLWLGGNPTNKVKCCSPEGQGGLSLIRFEWLFL